jgi:hypothetical protein
VLRRAQAIRALLRDSARLRQERQAFMAKRRNYAGYSRAQMSSSVAARGFNGVDCASSLRRSVRPCRSPVGAWQLVFGCDLFVQETGGPALVL